MAKRPPTDQLIPILISIDAEPDGTFIDLKQRVPWHGFEHSEAVIEGWREDISRATGRAAHFTWLLRMDPQIEKVYGSLGWCVESHGKRLEGLARQGDEIGLHVHPFRWSRQDDQWVLDYGNQDWVENCVEQGHRAFTQALGYPPRSFSMGNSWLNQPTVRILEKLGIDYDLSLLPGTGPTPIQDLAGPLGRVTGHRPDCSNLPRHPFRPAVDDFASPDATRRNQGPWVIPITTGNYRWPLWRRVAGRLRGPTRQRGQMTKLGLELGPAMLEAGLAEALGASPRPHLLMTTRSHTFLPAFRRVQSRMRRSLRRLLAHPQAGCFAFSTPAEALEVLGLEVQEGSRSSVP